MFTRIEKLETKNLTLNFSNAGLGVLETKAVLGNDVILINNTHCLEYEPSAFQAIICECCGIVNCEPGSWLSLRKAGQLVVLIPAVNEMRAGDWEHNEYQPPSYIRQLGPLSLTAEKYNELRSLVPKFPELENIINITAVEILSVHQVLIPGRVLGDIGKYKEIKTDNIIAVSDGELDDELYSLKLAVKAAHLNEASAISNSAERTVEFYFDLPNFPSWNGLGYKNGKPVLLY